MQSLLIRLGSVIAALMTIEDKEALEAVKVARAPRARITTERNPSDIWCGRLTAEQTIQFFRLLGKSFEHTKVSLNLVITII